MAEKDSLSNFDFNWVSKPGKYLKFEAGKPVTVRILTKDPVVQEKEFEGDGETNLSTKFCFIVWNFTDEKAQILSATPKMARQFQSIGTDEDFGTNLQKCDIKISPEGEKLKRTYTINVLRHSGNEKALTKDQVAEALLINLDEDVQDNRGRLSVWEPPDNMDQSAESGHAKAKAQAEKLRPTEEPEAKDVVIEDVDEEEPINLDDIPF